MKPWSKIETDAAAADGWTVAPGTTPEHLGAPLRRRAFLGLSVLAALAAGCSLRRPALPQQTFVLEPEPADPVPSGSSGGVLLVRTFHVAPAFESRAFVIRRGDSEYALDAYHAFLLSPAQMLTEYFSDWIRGLGVFSGVTTAAGGELQPTHALEGEVTALYGDYSEAARPKAVVGVRVRLFHPFGRSGAVLQWQREENRVEPMERASAGELVEGWRGGLRDICRAIEPLLAPRAPARRQPEA